MGLRRAVFLRFSLFLWGILLLSTLVFYSSKVLLGEGGAQRKQDLLTQSRIAQGYLLQGQHKDLVEYLRAELRAGKLGFFSWKKDGNWIASEGYRRGEWEGLRANGVEEIDRAIVSRLDSGSYELFLGHELGIRTELRRLWMQEHTHLYKDAALLLIGLVLIGLFFFRDIALRVLHARVGQDVPDVIPGETKPSPMPKALRHAKSEGKEPKPYLLFYTSPELFAEGGAERIHHICRRYGGEILRIEEDSLLVQFKQGLAEASACLRDLSDAKGKGSIVEGEAKREEWRGLKLISGSAFLRAKAVHMSQGVSFFIEGDGELFVRQKSGHLKWKTMDEALTQSGMLRYFRSDDAGRELLALLATTKGGRFEELLKEVRQINLSSRILGAPMEELLLAETQGNDPRRLSEVVSVVPHFLCGEGVTKQTEKILVSLLKHSHQRVRSNAIECLTTLFPFREYQELRALQRDQDQRIAANALIKRAIERLDEEVIEKLRDRLSKGSAHGVASSLYALGEIAQYYRNADPSLLGRTTKFEHLLEELGHWVQHPNPMIQRQALWAAEKAGRTLAPLVSPSEVQDDFKAA